MDLSKCYMIGDRWSDMAAAGKMGIKLVLVMTGRGEKALGVDREKWSDYIGMALYNGQRGSGHKQLFYWFYPAHVYLLYGASCLVYSLLQ